MNTKITIASAMLLASVSGALASEPFDVDIYRPAVSQTQSYEAYAQAPRAQRVQVERRQAVQSNAAVTAEDKSYWDHGSQID